MKIRCSLTILSLILWCVLMAAPHSVSADDNNLTWVSKIVSTQGQIYVKRAGGTDWQPVVLNDTFFPGDAVRVATNSRAGFLFSNESMLRVDQHTTLVFTGIEKKKTFLLELIEGAAYFFSRKSRSLKVSTPFVNGVVEGTEFLVTVDNDQSTITLYEGRVLAENSQGQITMAKGQRITATQDHPPQLQTVVHPRDAVQWALYYPPIITFAKDFFPETDANHWNTRLRRAIQAHEQGDDIQALTAMEILDDTIDDARPYVYRAGLLLTVGRIDQARQDIARALTLDDKNSTAMALQAIIAVVQNHKEDALHNAQQAVHLNPKSAAARLALSYALQAHFQLEAALETAQIVVQIEPRNGLAWARLAELDLSTGDLDNALTAAQKAATVAPRLAHIQTVLGFAYLTQIKIKNAQAAFTQAIDLDSTAPLPRLGLGLTLIRQGDLEAGRGQIEIAVALDPDNALLRSYLGKAYFDEKRAPLDERQFEMAKTLDPMDPTPWFYDAIRKQSLNRPGEALLDMQTAIELNDNRAVYRSRLLLDEDLAARSAGLGRIYNDLSFEELALRQGYKSLSADPTNYSAHRLLADMYASRPRHEIARVSELLQSQLLQPLNLTPLQPQLAESNLMIMEGTGPASLSFNEFNPLFTRNRTTAEADAVVGEQNTRGEDIIVSGLQGRFSYSVGQFHYETDGFRENNNLDQDIYNVFVQMALNEKHSLQFEYRNQEAENGDLGLYFDPERYSETLHDEMSDKISRIGYHYKVNANQDVLVSLIQSLKNNKREQTTDEFPVITYQNSDTDSESYSGEFQHIIDQKSYRLISGAGYTRQSESGTNEFALTVGDYTQNEINDADIDIRQTNIYLYWLNNYWQRFNFTAGLTFDEYNNGSIDTEQLNPKLGLNWSVIRSLNLRASAFRVLTRSWASTQTIEPTQLAGFNQFFDDPAGSDSWRYCFGADLRIGEKLKLGGEGTYRYIKEQVITSGSIDKRNHDEKSHRAYVYYMPHPAIGISTEFLYDHYSINSKDHIMDKPKVLDTQQLPISISVFSKSGLFLKLRGRHIYQKYEAFIIADGTNTESESFFIFDTALGLKFPNRIGTISLNVFNLGDTEFRYYDFILPSGSKSNRQIQPQRQIFIKADFSF